MTSSEEVFTYIAECNVEALLLAIAGAAQGRLGQLQQQRGPQGGRGGGRQAQRGRGKASGRAGNTSSGMKRGVAGPQEKAWQAYLRAHSDAKEQLSAAQSLQEPVVQRYIQARLEQARRLGYTSPTFPALSGELGRAATERYPQANKLVNKTADQPPGPDNTGGGQPSPPSPQAEEGGTAPTAVAMETDPGVGAVASGSGLKTKAKKRPKYTLEDLQVEIAALQAEIAAAEAAKDRRELVQLGGADLLKAKKKRLAELQKKLSALEINDS